MRDQRRGLPEIAVFAHYVPEGVALSRLESLVSAAREAVLALPGAHPAVLPDLSHVEINFVSDKTIAEVHRDFMGLPDPTDVITFQHGEAFVSLDTAVARAGEFGHSPEREAFLYVVHALLHLNGHEDKEGEEAAIMAQFQEAVVDQLWILPETD